MITDMGACRGGGGKSRSSPPFWKKISVWGAFLLLFSLYGGFFGRFSPCGRPFLSLWGVFGLPPSYEKILRVIMITDIVILF